MQDYVFRLGIEFIIVLAFFCERTDEDIKIVLLLYLEKYNHVKIIRCGECSSIYVFLVMYIWRCILAMSF